MWLAKKLNEYKENKEYIPNFKNKTQVFVESMCQIYCFIYSDWSVFTVVYRIKLRMIFFEYLPIQLVFILGLNKKYYIPGLNFPQIRIYKN